MPNTDPPQDSIAVIDFVREQGKRAGLVDVVPSGCITLGRLGETLAPMAELAQAGVTLFTDDGNACSASSQDICRSNNYWQTNLGEN